jgi:hypothetical protein
MKNKFNWNVTSTVLVILLVLIIGIWIGNQRNNKFSNDPVNSPSPTTTIQVPTPKVIYVTPRPVINTDVLAAQYRAECYDQSLENNKRLTDRMNYVIQTCPYSDTYQCTSPEIKRIYADPLSYKIYGFDEDWIRYCVQGKIEGNW